MYDLFVTTSHQRPNNVNLITENSDSALNIVKNSHNNTISLKLVFSVEISFEFRNYNLIHYTKDNPFRLNWTLSQLKCLVKHWRSLMQIWHLPLREVSKYGVFSGPYFPAFVLNTGRYSVSLRIQSKCRKIQTKKNSVLVLFFTQCTFTGITE